MGGDLNIDLLGINMNTVETVSSFQLLTFEPLIDRSTRVSLSGESATCIDHFWSNDATDAVSGIFRVGITDHYPIFTVLNYEKLSLLITKKFRDHSNVRIMNVKNRISEITACFNNMNYLNVNHSCECFLDKFYSIESSGACSRGRKIRT